MAGTRWRARSLPRPRGIYWLLETGRNATRRTLSLGYVTDDEASRALVTLQAEEDAGTASRILDVLHTEDPGAAVDYLVGRAGVATLLPAPRTDYGRMTLRDYQSDVYAP